MADPLNERRVTQSENEEMFRKNDFDDVQVSTVALTDVTNVSFASREDEEMVHGNVSSPESQPDMTIKKASAKKVSSTRKSQKASPNSELENTAEENNYEHLMRLLNKSQMYAQFVAMLAQKSLNKKEPPPMNPSVPSSNSTTQNGKQKKLSATKNPPKKRKKTANTTNKKVSTTTEAPSVGEASTSENASEIGQMNLVDGKRLTSLGLLVDPYQPIYLEGGILRDYQLAGFKWLKVLFETGMNGILADEMGLGKTIQIIALICHLYHKGVSGPFLIIGPLSTIPNWALEFDKFSPQIPVVTYHGPIEERKMAQSKISQSYQLGGLSVFPVVLTSYDMPRFDKRFLEQTNWKYIIVDEGHRLKNPNCILVQLLKKYKTVNKLLLTGTPIQNNLEELWSLLFFLLPNVFDSLTAFESWFSIKDMQSEGYSEHVINEERKRNIISKFHTILSPFLLRRVKTDVDLKLPPKKELIIKCPLSNTQLALYQGMMDHSLKLEKMSLENEIVTTTKSRSRRAPQIFGAPPEIKLLAPNNKPTPEYEKYEIMFKSPGLSNLTYSPCPWRSGVFVTDKNDGRHYMLRLKFANPFSMLKKAVNHPYLVKIPVIPGTDQLLDADERLITESGKMGVLDSLLTRLKAANHKVVLFSTMVTMLDLIEDFLLLKEYRYCRLDGHSKIEDRRSSIYEFNTNDDVFIFIISTRAGGLGINLCAADTVIIFDSDWNPQADLQAQDRCHRIGQTKPVIVYKLVCPGTIDENIVVTAHAKRKLEKLLIQSGGFDNQQKTRKNLSLEELKTILEEKMMTNETVIGKDELSEADWEKLMDRNFN